MCSVYPRKVFACYSQAVCYVALLTAVGDAAVLERYGRSKWRVTVIRPED